MLGNFISINNTTLICPKSFSMKYEDIENVNKSEAGTDIVSVTRLNKINCSIGYVCSHTLRNTLRTYATSNTVTLKLENESTGHTCRVRNYSEKLVEGTQVEMAGLIINTAGTYTDGTTNGVWDISFDMIEI